MAGGMMLRLGLGLLLLALLLPTQLEAQDTTTAAATTTASGGDSSGVNVLRCSVSVLLLCLSFLLHQYC